ncbi:MAG: DinB family protein [Candidatus Acidiferrales bacterium]
MQETPEEYRNRMLAHSQAGDPLKGGAEAPRKLERLLKGVAPSKLRKRPAPGKWSIAEIVAHLADAELVRGYRMRMILGAPGTPIQAFNQDDWVIALHYDKRSVRQSLEEFRALREANLALLKTLRPEQWKHHGMHSERGEETIELMTRMFAGHDVNHIRQIERILGAKKS